MRFALVTAGSISATSTVVDGYLNCMYRWKVYAPPPRNSVLKGACEAFAFFSAFAFAAATRCATRP